MIEKDKILHFCAGFLLSYVPYVLLMLFFAINPWISLTISTLVSLIASLLKEIVWDKMMGKGVMNWKDFYAGCIGDVVCLLFVGILIFV